MNHQDKEKLLLKCFRKFMKLQPALKAQVTGQMKAEKIPVTETNMQRFVAENDPGAYNLVVLDAYFTLFKAGKGKKRTVRA
jgi:hypothetical protein